MSKSAWLFLCLTLLSVALGLGTTSQQTQTLAFVASAVLGSLLVLTLIKGRRIKFDPLLR
ncbi:MULTISPECIES: PA3371 family protein [Pseudomonas]|uniref:PA3371 family protein n=1 Tax=Pseudomonas TaxID=286 RepID=UPI001F3A02FE|nr:MULTISPECIES: PA3371 family protein [Pseudomonas]MDO3692869.1 PA3371 family protein [Pseudomonas sp. DKN 2791]MDO7034954.1 PA3371 family protein [Pseudomonas sp. DKN 2792]